MVVDPTPSGSGLSSEEFDQRWEDRQDNLEEDGDEGGPRAERRSPAAVLGSKRVGVVMVSEEMQMGIERVIDGMSAFHFILSSLCQKTMTGLWLIPCADVDPNLIRRAFLALRENPQAADQIKITTRDRREGKTRMVPEMMVAKAAAMLPGEYAAVRNVFEEMERRLGKGWIEEAGMRAERSSRPYRDEQVAASLQRTPSEEANAKELDQSTTRHAKQSSRRISIVESSGTLGPGLW